MEEEKLNNQLKSYYKTDENGVLWFYCGNWRTRVREYFKEDGKTITELLADAIIFAAKQPRENEDEGKNQTSNEE